MVLVVCIGERRVGEECELGGELETACLLCWPWMGGGALRGVWLREEGRD